jgi:PRTRC genetic system protein A
MDARDIALQQSAPVVTVPRYGGFTPLTENGHRFLVTGDGLWLEARRPWLYLRVPLVARKRSHALWLRGRELSLTFGKIPRIWSSTSTGMPLIGVPRMRRLDRVECRHRRDAAGIFGEVSSGCSHVRYTRPVLGDDEHLVVDLHSHGQLSAFFSTEDDRDDRGEFKIAGVLGNCDRGQCSTAFRFCANGLFLPWHSIRPA